MSSSNNPKSDPPKHVPYTVPYTGSAGELVNGSYVASSSLPQAQMNHPTHGSMGASNKRPCGPTKTTHPGEPNSAAARGPYAGIENKKSEHLDAVEQPLKFAKSMAGPKNTGSVGH